MSISSISGHFSLKPEIVPSRNPLTTGKFQITYDDVIFRDRSREKIPEIPIVTHRVTAAPV